MNWIESRMTALEQRVEGLMRLIQDLIPQLRNAYQTARNAASQYPLTTTAPGAGAFRCIVPAGGIAAGSSATGVTIQQMVGGAWTNLPGTATVYNPMPADACTAGHTLTLVAVGDGTYVAYSQSCT